MTDADDLVDDAISLVAEWVARGEADTTGRERATGSRLHGVIDDADGLVFAMRFVDRVVRPESPRVAAEQMRSLVAGQPLPGFLSAVDRLLLRMGARLAPRLPAVVMPLAVARMRQLIGHLVVDADPPAMIRHLRTRREEGFRLNVNLLGEAVLGEAEADRRRQAAAELLTQPHVDYVSVKVSAIVAQLNPWDHDGNVQRVKDRLRPLYRRAAATDPPTFVNLDMEEYHDLDLTIAAFTSLLDEPDLIGIDAGIVLQTYLPDSFPALQGLVEWAGHRHGTVKVRLVKGANLAMERVDAALHGWPQAPYPTKAETDANYKRCVDWLLDGERMRRIRLGLASHNLFDVAWTLLLAERRGLADRVEVEMLQGMAPAQARVVRDDRHGGGGLLLYTPVVARADFDVAIGYLFRRLEENASDENFIRHLFTLRPGDTDFRAEAAKFRAAVEHRVHVAGGPRRTQNRLEPAPRRDPTDPTVAAARFDNEPDTDPSLAANRRWAAQIVARPAEAPVAPVTTDTATVDGVVAAARAAQPAWAERPAGERRALLHALADELARRRGDLVTAMVHEGSKTIAEADPEVSEAIDFARWYGDRTADVERSPAARFEPLGVIAVVPPWNFPVAIPTGGVTAALAAGNAVILKPAPEVPRCAEIVAECCAEVGAGSLVRYLRTGDDEVGRHLVTHHDVDAVILTGAYETAELFRSWKPGLRIFAETSGKNAMVITPHADLDLAVADLVASAFGHSGQKCSATSLAICVGDVDESPRFRRQLTDAVRSLAVGPAHELSTTMNPVIAEPSGKLSRGLAELDPGESWLVAPRRVTDRTWTPGVRLGVAPGSWFHRTECFGPVLGVMAAADLDEAIEIQNGTDYGLTGGIHTLDPAEIEHWLDRVEVGNAYVNRVTTGAIVRRQPFGGWKRSVIGPGAKAGGPNYVTQLGRWAPSDDHLPGDQWLGRAAASDEAAWAAEFGVDHDPTGLSCESNVLRYRPRPGVIIRVEADARPHEVQRALAGARRAGADPIVSRSDDEAAAAFAGRVAEVKPSVVRVIGTTDTSVRDAVHAAGAHLADDPVTSDGRIELLHYLREQSISRTLHRYGNLVDTPTPTDPRRHRPAAGTVNDTDP